MSKQMYPRYASEGRIFLVGSYSTKEGEQYINHCGYRCIVTKVILYDVNEDVEEVRCITSPGDTMEWMFLAWEQSNDEYKNTHEYIEGVRFVGLISTIDPKYCECDSVLYLPQYPVSKIKN